MPHLSVPLLRQLSRAMTAVQLACFVAMIGAAVIIAWCDHEVARQESIKAADDAPQKERRNARH